MQQTPVAERVGKTLADKKWPWRPRPSPSPPPPLRVAGTTSQPPPAHPRKGTASHSPDRQRHPAPSARTRCPPTPACTRTQRALSSGDLTAGEGWGWGRSGRWVRRGGSAGRTRGGGGGTARGASAVGSRRRPRGARGVLSYGRAGAETPGPPPPPRRSGRVAKRREGGRGVGGWGPSRPNAAPTAPPPPAAAVLVTGSGGGMLPHRKGQGGGERCARLERKEGGGWGLPKKKTRRARASGPLAGVKNIRLWRNTAVESTYSAWPERRGGAVRRRRGANGGVGERWGAPRWACGQSTQCAAQQWEAAVSADGRAEKTSRGGKNALRIQSNHSRQVRMYSTGGSARPLQPPSASRFLFKIE